MEKQTADKHRDAGPAIDQELEHGADPAADDRRELPLVARRPAELAGGLTIAGGIYGWLTQAGASHELAAVLAVLLAFLPGAVSYTVDLIRGE